MKFRKVSIAVSFVSLMTVTGCFGDAREDAVIEAFHSLQDGLRMADGGVLWGIVDDETEEYFDSLATSVRATCKLVSDSYPADGKVVALRSVGGDLISTARDGRSLFVFMLDPRKLAPPKDVDSSHISEIRFSGSMATVITVSGDTVVFQKKKSGAYGTPMFLEAFRELPAVVTLRDNIKIAQDNCRLLGVDVK
jgi:hypothetical protein